MNDEKLNKTPSSTGILRYLVIVLIVLVVLQLVLMPFIFKKLYAQRPRSEDRVITYDRGKLNFGTKFKFTPTGDLQLELFDAVYEGQASSSNGDKIVVPGTDGHDTIQLRNSVHGDIRYTAVLYMIRDNEQLPIKAELAGVNFEDTERYNLPFEIQSSEIIRAVSGKLSSEEVVNFELFWRWDYYESDDRDVIDTDLGSKDLQDNIVLGMHLTVEDDNFYITPQKKSSKVAGYCFATFATAVATAALFFFYSKSKKGSE